MSRIYTSNLVQNGSMTDIVNAINDGGTVEGVEGIEFTSEMLAGNYAYNCALEAGFGFEEANLDFHLDVLYDNYKAKFDYSDARDYALKLSEAE